MLGAARYFVNVEGWAKKEEVCAKKEGFWAKNEKLGKEWILLKRVDFRGQRKFSDDARCRKA